MGSESDVRHGPLQAAGAIRPSLPWCFNVARSVLGVWVSSLELVSCGFSRHGQLQAAGHGVSVFGARVSSLKLASCGFRK